MLLPLGTVTVKKKHGVGSGTAQIGRLSWALWALCESTPLGLLRLSNLYGDDCFPFCARAGDTSQLWGEGYPLRYLGGYTFCLWTWMVGFPRRFPAFQIFTHFTILPPRNSSPREYICKVPFQFSKGEKKEGEREYLQSHGCPKHVEYQTKIHLSRWGQSVDARPAGTYVCWVWLIWSCCASTKKKTVEARTSCTWTRAAGNERRSYRSFALTHLIKYWGVARIRLQQPWVFVSEWWCKLLCGLFSFFSEESGLGWDGPDQGIRLERKC
jgi:hypothetical protein